MLNGDKESSCRRAAERLKFVEARLDQTSQTARSGKCETSGVSFLDRRQGWSMSIPLSI